MEITKSQTSAIPANLIAWIPISLILLIATGLRFYQLDSESLWIDEMLSIRTAERMSEDFPWARPFYFILLKVWMLFGTSDAWLRSLGVLFGIGGVFLTYQLGRRLAGESTGLIAAILMTLSPLFINHAQEIRMYSLSVFFSLSGTLALTYALESATLRSLSCWALARWLAIVTTPLNLFLLLPDMVLFGWKNRHQYRQLLVFGLGLSLIGLLSLPTLWIQAFGGAAGEYATQWAEAEFAKPGVIQVSGMLEQMTAYWPVRHLLTSENEQVIPLLKQMTDTSLLSTFWLTLKENNLLLYRGFIILLVGGFTILLVGLLTIPLIRLFTKYRSEQLLWVTAWAFLPAGVMLGISHFFFDVWSNRYLLSIAPYFHILIVTGFIFLWRWQRSFAALIAIAYVFIMFNGLKDYYTVTYRDDWLGAAQIVNNAEKAGDILVFYNNRNAEVDKYAFNLFFHRYYDGFMPIYFINPSMSEKILGVISVDRKPLPSTSRLWLICSLSCKEKQEIEQAFQFLMNGAFQVTKHETLRSLSNDSIEVYLVEADSSSQKVRNNNKLTLSTTTE